MDLLCFCSVLCLLCFVRVCLYVLRGHLLGKGWPLGSRLWCILWVCHFPIGILGQVWYLIVSIPDLWNLTYFVVVVVVAFFCLEKLYNKIIVDYWGIGHDVISTWEYQYWPRLRSGRYHIMSNASIVNNCIMSNASIVNNCIVIFTCFFLLILIIAHEIKPSRKCANLFVIPSRDKILHPLVSNVSD